MNNKITVTENYEPIFRASSSDWIRSITFTQDIINSDKWTDFKTYMTKNGFSQWERAINKQWKTDINHFTYSTFNLITVIPI